jgi:hypothetical protein
MRRSRIQLSANWHAPPALFWRANSLAFSIWGTGFQFDRFSATSNAQPVDLRRRLPFNSEYMQPFSSGCNALAQEWRGFVNWCNPPFVMLTKVFSLLRAQRATAAVVVPLRAKQRWSPWIRPGASGVVGRFEFDPSSPAFRMSGAPPCSYRSGFAVIFLDFRVGDSPFVSSPSAEQLRIPELDATDHAGPLLFCRVGGARGVLDWQTALSASSGVDVCPSFLR